MKNDKNKTAKNIPLEEVAEHVRVVLRAVDPNSVRSAGAVVDALRSLSWIYEKFGVPAGVSVSFAVLCVIFGTKGAGRVCNECAQKGTLKIPVDEEKMQKRSKICEVGKLNPSTFKDALATIRGEKLFKKIKGRDECKELEMWESGAITVPENRSCWENQSARRAVDAAALNVKIWETIVRRLREELPLTVAAVAREVGISQQYFYRIFSEPDSETERLANHLNIPLKPLEPIKIPAVLTADEIRAVDAAFKANDKTTLRKIYEGARVRTAQKALNNAKRAQRNRTNAAPTLEAKAGAFTRLPNLETFPNVKRVFKVGGAFVLPFPPSLSKALRKYARTGKETKTLLQKITEWNDAQKKK